MFPRGSLPSWKRFTLRVISTFLRDNHIRKSLSQEQLWAWRASGRHLREANPGLKRLFVRPSSQPLPGGRILQGRDPIWPGTDVLGSSSHAACGKYPPTALQGWKILTCLPGALWGLSCVCTMLHRFHALWEAPWLEDSSQIMNSCMSCLVVALNPVLRPLLYFIPTFCCCFQRNWERASAHT